jgi:CRP-like cAMP-binding protein
LSEKTCPVYRDSLDNFKALERLFGSMTVGMAFGESGFLNTNDNRARFYNAVALTECVCLTISKSDYLRYLDKQEKKSQNEKLYFIK